MGDRGEEGAGGAKGGAIRDVRVGVPGQTDQAGNLRSERGEEVERSARVYRRVLEVDEQPVIAGLHETLGDFGQRHLQ